MKAFAKGSIVFLAGILLSVFFSQACLAADLEEKGRRVSPSVSGGKITLVKVIINAANGGPKVDTLQLAYSDSTILIADVSLTVKKGFYQIELLEKGKPSLTLKAQAGKTVKGNGRLSVNAGGTVQYRVTAKKAKDIAFDFSFSPLNVPDESRVSRTSSEAAEADGLNLKLTCSAGKNCLLQVQNMSRSKSYRNILFRIDYKMMTREGTVEKSKNGGIADPLFPDKTGEWPIDLVFGEIPKDIRVLLINADKVDPAEIKAPGIDQKKNSVIPLISLEKQKENDAATKPTVPVPAPLPGSNDPANKQIKL